MPKFVRFRRSAVRGGLLLAIALLSLTTVLHQPAQSFPFPFRFPFLRPQTVESVHLLLGNPSEAVPDVNTPDNFLIARPQYALSYNRDKSIANWVSWQLNRSWLGTLPRGQFAPDTSLPSGWYQVTPADYTGSGFDRGHLVPASDRDRTQQDVRSVFLMTNILPQAPDNNQGPWEKLESYCRELVRQGKELYIVAGWAGTGGTGSRGRKNELNRAPVAVPAKTWKVVLVLDRPGLGVQDITADARAIAVIMPNTQGIKERSWQDFRVSVKEVELLTGYDFFSTLPPNLQGTLENRVDDR